MLVSDISSAIPDDAPAVDDSDNEDEDMQMESDKRITSKWSYLCTRYVSRKLEDGCLNEATVQATTCYK